MNARTGFYVAFIALAVLAGCSRENEQGVGQGAGKQKSEQKNASPYNALGQFTDDAVLIRCGTNDFTKAMAKCLVDLRVRLIHLAMPGQEIKIDDAIAARILASAPLSFPRECAVIAFAATNGIAAGDTEVSLMRTRAMQGANQGFSSWPSFVRKLGTANRETLNERIRVEAITESVRKWHAANRPAPVTKAEITEYRRRQIEYNQRAAATNAVTFALATNVWHSLQRGLSFEEAVTKYSTDETNTGDGVWGEFNLNFFNENVPLKDIVSSLKTGQIAPPVEGDNGLMIIRLDSKRVEDDGQTIYTLSRIFFHLPEFYPELDDVTFEKEISAARQSRKFNEFVDDLTKKLPVTYPNGEAIFENARRTAKQPVMM